MGSANLYSMKARIFAIVVPCVLGPIYLNSVAAHSFNVGLIEYSSAEWTRSARNGFLLATREQDAHAFEESDGHLGGLDVYLIDLGSLDDAGASQRLAESEALFAVGFAPSQAGDALLDDHGVVLVDPARANYWQAAVDTPTKLRTLDGAGFYDRFIATYGDRPDIPALHAYLAARVVAAVIRQSTPALRANPERLRAAVARKLQGPEL